MPDQINLQRVKELTANYYMNPQNQVNDQQGQQLIQQNQQDQKSLHQQQKQQKQAISHDVKQDQKKTEVQKRHPILQNAPILPENANINEPTEDVIESTYSQIGITLKDTRKRELLTSGRRRFGQLEILAEKALSQEQRPARHIRVQLSDAVKLSDSSLINHFGEFTGANRYLYLRYSILSNRYYPLLPTTELFKLSRQELIGKLSMLYAAGAKERNAELIAFFENVIRIKDIEDSIGKKTQPLQLQIADAITEDERRKNISFLRKNHSVIEESQVSERDKYKRITLMRKIMDPADPAEEFLEESTVTITPGQKEGIRQVLSWMYRNSCKSKNSKISFVHKLATSKPEQILLACYLVEKKKTDSPSGDEFYEATHGYVPNLDTIKSNVISSRLKFWKRLGNDASDSVINWSILGAAVRYATSPVGPDTPSDIENYARYTGEIAKTNALLKKDPPSSDQRRNHLVQLLQHKGNLILTYYRSGRLSPDMPIDMLPNERMREETEKLLQEISQGIEEFAAISKELPDINYDDAIRIEDALSKDEASSSTVISVLGKAMDPLNVVSAGDMGVGTSTSFSTTMARIIHTANYSFSSEGFRSITGIIGVILAISNLADLKSSPVLTGKGRLAEGLQATGEMGFGLGVTAQAGTDLLGRFIDLGSAPQTNINWYGKLEPNSLGSTFSSVSGGVQFSVGCVTALTGAMMTTAGAIQLGRVRKSNKSINESQKALAKKGRTLTDNEKKLRNFLSHEKRVAGSNKSSAIVQTFSGVLTTLGGTITATGILTPLGGVLGIIGIATNMGYGLYHSWSKKDQIIKSAVDESLNITDEKVLQLREEIDDLQAKSKDEVRGMIRQEALGKLGFATYKEYFAHCMKEYATLLFDQVMNHEDSPDWDMYHDALASLGMKIDVTKKIPTLTAIYSKLMK